MNEPTKSEELKANRNFLTPEQCAEQFDNYAASNPSKDSQHSLRFCANFIREFCIGASSQPQEPCPANNEGHRPVGSGEYGSHVGNAICGDCGKELSGQPQLPVSEIALEAARRCFDIPLIHQRYEYVVHMVASLIQSAITKALAQKQPEGGKKV